MRILITGGLGYLGGRLTEMLCAAGGHELRLSTRRAAESPSWAHGARIVTTDWSSDRDLLRACEGVEAVIHLAGMNAADCARDPAGALEFNGTTTARLVRAAAEQGVRRFIYLSTAHVYGRALAGVVSEDTTPQPTHPYATSHLAGEDGVLAAHQAQRLTGIVVRLSNAFGAPLDACSDGWSLFINDACRQAVRSGRIVLKTSGRQRRDFIPVSEACRALAHLLLLPADRLGETLFNVGGEWAPTILAAAERVARFAEMRAGARPQIQVGTTDETMPIQELEYSIGRLKSAGFVPRATAIAADLERLFATA